MRALAVLTLLLASSVLRADEADDLLARQLAAEVRDPRLTMRVRIEAAKTLGKLGPRAAVVVPDLTAQVIRLKGVDLAPLQEAVIDALGEIGSASKPALAVLPLAVGRNADIDQSIKRSTAAIFAAGESQDLGVLIRQMLSQDASVRLRAVKAAGLTRNRMAAPALTKILSDPDGDVRRAAIASLRIVISDELPVADIVSALTLDLTDPDADNRLLAARSLAKFGKAAAPATTALEALQADPDRDVRKAAADALAKIAGQ